MSLKPKALDLIPDETARVAHAAFPKGNIYLRIRDELGPIYKDESFVELFDARGQPAQCPSRLAWITILQFAEALSDRQAAEAVRSRIDWKYLLGLELTDSGFDASVLSEFRGRLVAGSAECLLFELLLDRLREAGLLKARTRQRTDSTHVLASIQALNRLECVGEVMRHALDSLARVAPDWIQQQAKPEWFERYARPFEESRLPASRAQRYALAETIGRDGHQLLSAIYEQSPEWMRQIPAVETLRRVWVQQFQFAGEVVRWREAGNLPPAAIMIYSPYDLDARFGKKRNVEWKGYKVHLTECCDQDLPLVITDVQTTHAATTDFEMLEQIQTDLAVRDLLPEEHIVDSGYMTGEHLVRSRNDYDITLVGPMLPDPSWQARARNGFDISTFAIDWESKLVRCPEGKASTSWVEGRNAHGHENVHVTFRSKDCGECRVRGQCTKSRAGARTLTISARPYHEALQEARQREKSEEFIKKYHARAGVEGTISQGVRVGEMRRSRYVGLAKTHLQHLVTATALNVVRIGAWLMERPRAETRRSAFAALASKAA